MNNINSKRVHDSFYAKEDHFTIPKEYFKEAINLIKENGLFFGDIEEASLLDVGCAAGDFLRYFQSQLNKKSIFKLYGIDIMDSLLTEAKTRIPSAKLDKIDVGYTKQNLKNFYGFEHDVITMFGVNCIFDDFIWLDNLFSGLKKNGLILLYGIFNPYPYDVILRVKKSRSKNWEPGWNVISKESIIDYCAKKGYQACFKAFEPDLSIAPNPNDGLRSWTIDLEKNKEKISEFTPLEQNRRRIFTSANRLIYDWHFCLIQKEK